MKVDLDLKKQVFMFFSGGVDSVLLALMLQKSYIDFKAVFILYKPFIEVNYKDYLRAQRISKLLGIELEIVEADYDISKKEIKDVLSYLRLIINPNDEEALKRIINFPGRGIGQTTVDRLIVSANEHNKTIFEILIKITYWKRFCYIKKPK